MTVDINLPGMNGFELARALKGRYSRMETIIISVNGNPLFQQEAERLNCPYIKKESLAEELPPILDGLNGKIGSKV